MRFSSAFLLGEPQFSLWGLVFKSLSVLRQCLDKASWNTSSLVRKLNFHSSTRSSFLRCYYKHMETKTTVVVLDNQVFTNTFFPRLKVLSWEND